MERLNPKKLNEVEGKEEYSVKNQYKFSSFEILDNEVRNY
jgi:hypothetical protein